MGIDDRNQLEMVESMPGGVEGVRQMVADFHRRGVRVLFPMMMWDEGTHQPSQPWPQAIAELMKQIDADGVNGDTQDGVPLGFSLAADQIGHPLAFEPEGGPSDEALAWNVMTWGQYSFPFIPMVDRYKWLETRHMVNISDRWAVDQHQRPAICLLQRRRMGELGKHLGHLERHQSPGCRSDPPHRHHRARCRTRFSSALTGSRSTPCTTYGVYASRWPLGDQTVWTIVNRTDYDIGGRQMDLKTTPGMRYFDLYHGVELKPETDGPLSVLSFNVEANGYGAILATPGDPSDTIKNLMQRMASVTAKPLASFSHEPVVLQQHLVETAATKPAAEAPEGMVKIPGGSFVFRVRGTEIEGGSMNGVDLQYPWENSPRRFHEHAMTIKPFFIDKFPVTNAQFKQFLDATHYAPRDAGNFLRDWKNGAYPQAWDNRPVTWVSLEDARAYAAWAGKRLPHEWEWQFAAEGTDGRIYPWGDDWNPANVPTPDGGRSMRGPDPVGAHPQGASPYGVQDLVGNVWQWTDEFEDDHTRAAIVRGGSYYQPQGSIWYFPQAYRNDEHSKVLLMAPSYDRSGGVGFRCVRDTQ